MWASCNNVLCQLKFHVESCSEFGVKEETASAEVIDSEVSMWRDMYLHSNKKMFKITSAPGRKSIV